MKKNKILKELKKLNKEINSLKEKGVRLPKTKKSCTLNAIIMEARISEKETLKKEYYNL